MGRISNVENRVRRCPVQYLLISYTVSWFLRGVPPRNLSPAPSPARGGELEIRKMDGMLGLSITMSRHI
jgi:hypothetical protein